MTIVACAPGTLVDFRVLRKVEPISKEPKLQLPANTTRVTTAKTTKAPEPQVVIMQPEDKLPSTQPTVPSAITVDSQNIVSSRVRVALLLPLSGPSSLLGQAMLHAAELALFEIGNEMLDLFVFDTSGTKEGAAIAAESAVKSQVRLILGPLLARSTSSVAPIARSAGINVLSFSNSREVSGDGMFILGFVPRQQVETIVEYAADQGHTKFAVLAPKNPYGTAVVDALREAASARDVFVTKISMYAPGAPDVSAEIRALADYDARRAELLAQRAELEARNDEISQRALRRLESLDTIGGVDFDAILVPEGGQVLRTLVSLLSFYDVDQPSVRLLGIRVWDEYDDLGTEPALVGAWFSAPPLAERAKFENRYSKTFDNLPRRLASIAYDATALASVLAGSEGAPDFSIKTLTNKDGFLGYDGVFRLLPDGSVERFFAVFEVRRSGFRTLRSAPHNFRQTTN